MKNILDIIQILLSNPVGCAVIALLIVIMFKIVRVAILDLLSALNNVLSRYFIKLNTWNALKAVFVALGLIIFSPEIIDYIQRYEQTQVNPTYYFESQVTDGTEISIFENEIKRNVGTNAFEVVQKYCKMASDTLGCSMSDIYAVALSECALNPFIIHKKGCAAGFTQLTNAGCSGLYLNGTAVTLDKVKEACNNRNIEYIMQTAFAYWVDRAKGRKCKNMKDFYLLVFAPAFVGCSDSAVLYEGKDNPSYYQNDVFDGYFVDENERICRLDSRMDYRITAGEVNLHVTKKKINFLKSKKI